MKYLKLFESEIFQKITRQEFKTEIRKVYFDTKESIKKEFNIIKKLVNPITVKNYRREDIIEMSFYNKSNTKRYYLNVLKVIDDYYYIHISYSGNIYNKETGSNEFSSLNEYLKIDQLSNLIKYIKKLL